MKSGLALAFAAGILMLGALPQAHAQGTTDSFVDVDNNGVWSQGDLPLAQFLGPDSFGFNCLQPQKGWTPRTHPVGLVVQGRPLLLSNDFNHFLMTGNIKVMTDVKVVRRDLSVSFLTLNGDVTIGAGVKVNAAGDIDFTAAAGSVTVGAKSSFSTKGEFYAVTLDAARALTLDADVSASLTGGYNSIVLRARNTLSVAPGFSMKGPAHGIIDIMAASDITLTDVDLKAGYIRVEAYTDALHPQSKRVRIVDSSLNQTYRNGDFRLIANTDMVGRYASQALILERTKIKTKDPLALYIPDPVVR